MLTLRAVSILRRRHSTNRTPEPHPERTLPCPCPNCACVGPAMRPSRGTMIKLSGRRTAFRGLLGRGHRAAAAALLVLQDYWGSTTCSAPSDQLAKEATSRWRSTSTG